MAEPVPLQNAMHASTVIAVVLVNVAAPRVRAATLSLQVEGIRDVREEEIVEASDSRKTTLRRPTSGELRGDGLADF